MNQQLTKLAFVALALQATGAMAHILVPPVKKPLPAPPTATRKFIDPQNMDMSVKPGDNFYLYANGNWLKKNEIPASKTSWGSFNELRDKSVAAMKTLLDDAAKTTTKGRLYQMVGDFYSSGMDTAAIDQRGFDPILTHKATGVRIFTST